MKLNYKNSLLNKTEIEKTINQLKPEIQKIKKAKGYDNVYASKNLPYDKKLLKEITKTIKEKKKLKPAAIIVVGIGGSNLGTIAIHEALHGQFYNEKSNLKIYFVDTVDSDKIKDILELCENYLKKRKNVLINVVTKSGSTTETIANFEVFGKLIKKYKKNYKKHIVITTDVGSKLWNFAEGYTKLSIPKLVGGRYSVFSAVGLFPLGMLGVNLTKIQSGAKDMIKKCTTYAPNNPAAISATFTYLHNKKRNVSDLFLFSTRLQSTGKWYRQLMGESIGKEWNKKHTHKIHSGITPTISIGSTDLHSMAQLYLGGPQDKFTTFVTVTNNSEVKLPVWKKANMLVENIQGKKMSFLMIAIFDGVKIAFRKGKRPFIEIKLEKKNEKEIAGFLQFKMMEMMYLGYLLNVNPFDQPNVEEYKKETRRLLM